MVVLDKGMKYKEDDRVKYIGPDYYRLPHNFVFGTVALYLGSIYYTNGDLNVRWDGYRYSSSDAHALPEKYVSLAKDHYVNEFIKNL